MNRRILKIPTVSSSKNPRDVRPMWEEFRARNRAEKRPTPLPPMSLPKKYMAKHVNVPIITGNITQKLKTGSVVRGLEVNIGAGDKPNVLAIM